MAKNILAFLGMVFLTLLILASVVLVGGIYQSVGLITLPDGVVHAIQTPLAMLTPGPVEVKVAGVGTAVVNAIGSGVGNAEWSDPLAELPTVTETPTLEPTPIPTPTQTPVPPIEAGAYRAEVLTRMKTFAGALQQWLADNEKLTQDQSLIDDAAWQNAIVADLENIRLSGQDLAGVVPPPPEYAGIQSWLVKASVDAQSLSVNYSKALKSRDPKMFVAAGDNFSQIKNDLKQAVDGMLAAGWTMQ